MTIAVGDYVLIYKNQSGVLFSEKGDLIELKERKKELNNSRFFTAWILKVIETPDKSNN